VSNPRNLLAVLAMAAVLGAGPAAGVVWADPAGEPHLPDLRTLRPTDLRVQVSGSTKRLRLTNTVANRGDGPLEVRPQNDAGSKTTVAIQRIYTHSKAGTWSLAAEKEVGTFVFHPAHNHWHLEGFARYDLLNRNGKVVRSSRKVSFCLVDSVFVADPPPHAAPWAYNHACSQSEEQGISVGWGDIYSWKLAGQSVNITGLPNGRYRLRSTADPADRIEETDETNNASVIRFKLRGRRIIVLD
jgi:hypothetical protein